MPRATSAEIEPPPVADGDVQLLRDARRAEREKLRTSRFDVVTSFFMALIWFIGTFVVLMFIIWLLSGDPRPMVLKPQIEEASGRGENAEGFERDFEPPGEEEVEELLEPTLEDTIEAVTDSVSSVAATLTSNDTQATATNVGTGMGDSRPPGPPGEGPYVVPRGERWQLNFTAKDIKSYAKQLDFFGIELAVMGGGTQGVDYAFNLAGNPKSRRLVDTSTEKRLYFMWTRPSPLQRFDQQLLMQAGVSLDGGRTQLRFIPPELEDLLYTIEMTHAFSKGRETVQEIAKTVFECKPGGDGFTFEVIDQRYRSPKP
ncbi:hypothetical protein [Crateriforma conspicua]|uniref:Uncharacterized protein n=1 Tax=Crateriforma conspicua TaxID=2527996 RepID=A0A5C5Y7N1_9PLAN|nr:hypothetical protein [Crateriforma conspicua]QDV65580.1 hypothetical protein Mal65_47520 [Crateriforma conspicua]TWT70979.1 hypothetical protein Pan14r_32880 [Crateriforma conspicua]